MLLLDNRLVAFQDGDVPYTSSSVILTRLLLSLDEDLTWLVVTRQPGIDDGTVLDFRHFRDRFLFIYHLLFLGCLCLILLL
jgi:hypothetical protein